MAAEDPLDKNKGRCFLQQEPEGKKIKLKVSEREDKRIRGVKRNEGK